MQRHLIHIITLILLCVGIVGETTAQSIEVNFIAELAGQVPAELQAATTNYLVENISFLATSETRFSVTSYRIDETDTWAELYIVPTYIVEGGWDDVLIEDSSSVSLLAEQVTAGQWRVIFRDALMNGLSAQSLPPTEFIDLSEPIASQALNLSFPWIKGQSWFKTQGWHSGNALDFQPINHSSYTNPSTDLAVLAGEAGRVNKVCDDGQQVLLKIEHSGFTTQHLHVQANSVPAEILGQQVPKGMYLGYLYTGTAGGGGGYRFRTNCGYGTAIHLHTILSSRNVNICGISANSISGSPFATTYTSCNANTVRPKNPGKPALTAPTANQSLEVGSIKFTWNRGALNWTGKFNTQVQISTTSDFSQLVVNKWYTGRTVTISLPNAGSYWIRLRQGDTVSRKSGWTSAVKFTLTPPPPPLCLTDLNGDRTIDIIDVQTIAGYIISSDLAYDVNQDGTLNILDVQTIAGKIGQTCPA